MVTTADAQTVTPFLWQVRIYYEDTDSGGVVYHANYLKYMERARTEFLRSLGIELDRTAQEHGAVFAVRAVQLDFLRPALLNDQLNVSVEIRKLGRASVDFRQEISRLDSALVLCAATVKIACIDQGNWRPRPLPENIKREITRVSSV